MTPNQNPENPSIADAGLGNTGVRRSGKTGEADKTAALVEALERSNQAQAQLLEQNRKLQEQLEAQNSNNAINQLAEILAKAVSPVQQGPTAADEVNKTTDFKNTRAMVDGRNLAETQLALQEFRNERRFPISIPKSIANFVGPNLVVTVNGIRVSIPCDGKTYYINETHYLHARERIAKVDARETSEENNFITMG